MIIPRKDYELIMQLAKNGASRAISIFTRDVQKFEDILKTIEQVENSIKSTEIVNETTAERIAIMVVAT